LELLSLYHDSLFATNGGLVKAALPTLHYSSGKWRW
jgi:hypothetical protein